MVERIASSRGLLALSTVFIVYATTLPFDFSRAPSLEGANLVPLWDEARGRLHSVPDIVQNVVLFIPFGFFFVLSFAHRSIVRATVAGFLLSLLAESLQTMTTLRQTSATDLTTNTAGTLIGAIAASIWGAHLERVFRARLARTLELQPGLVVVAGMGAIVVFSMLAPFIPTLDVGALRAQVRSLLDHPWGVRPIGASIPEAILFAGFAFAFTHEVPARLGIDRAMSRLLAGIAGCVALALGLELAQMPLLFHRPAGLDVAANVLGGACGAALAMALHGGRSWAPDPQLGAWTRRWPAVVLALAVLAPTARALSPFQFRPLAEGLAALSWVHLVPFSLLFETLKVSTFLNVFETAATYLPLGYALYVLRVRPAAAFGMAILLAEVLELAQIAVVGRTADVTEGMLAAAGALAGWTAARSLTTVAAAPLAGESAPR